MTARLMTYVRRAYRPAVHVPYMVLWAVGLTTLFAVTDGRVGELRFGWGLVVTAVTLAVDMLLLRAMDDVRDHEYDSVHNPDRPLPSGAVRVRDLYLLVGVGIAALLALNAARGGLVVGALALHLAFTVLIVGVEHRTGWPPGDRLFANLLVNLPVQPLLSLYVYAAFAHDHGVGFSTAAIAPIVAVSLAGLCIEFGRKATHRVAPGERTYVSVLGARGTTTLALCCAVAAAAVAAGALLGRGPAWLVAVPLLFPLWAAWRFLEGRPRWPALAMLAYPMAAFLSFALVGVLSKWVTWG